MARVRLNWQIKTLLPVALVLLNGLLFFALITLTLQDPARNQVLAVGFAGAIVDLRRALHGAGRGDSPSPGGVAREDRAGAARAISL